MRYVHHLFFYCLMFCQSVLIKVIVWISFYSLFWNSLFWMYVLVNSYGAKQNIERKWEKKIKFLLILCSTKSMFHLRVLAWIVAYVNTAIMHDCFISEQKNNLRGYNVPSSLSRVHYCTHAWTRYMLKLTFFYVYMLPKLL